MWWAHLCILDGFRNRLIVHVASHLHYMPLWHGSHHSLHDHLDVCIHAIVLMSALIAHALLAHVLLARKIPHRPNCRKTYDACRLCFLLSVTVPLCCHCICFCIQAFSQWHFFCGHGCDLSKLCSCEGIKMSFCIVVWLLGVLSCSSACSFASCAMLLSIIISCARFSQFQNASGRWASRQESLPLTKWFCHSVLQLLSFGFLVPHYNIHTCTCGMFHAGQ